ncbi:HupE/UreJ family protein [Gottfriedia luciferensis]|uniref:HupE/UreJ family protein n=1 Tax=Gottfriedia luciferensis TaxID=178774 RepID=UPI001F192A60|nr:HupE/UreJ family protein [Gottfriedia luciferensis]
MRTKSIIFSFITAIILFLIQFPSSALAHNYSASYTDLKIEKDQTIMKFSLDTISVIELIPGIDKNKNYLLEKSEIKSGRHHLEELITERLALDKNNIEQTPKLEKMKLVKKTNNIFLTCYLIYPSFSPGENISLTDGLYSGDSGTTNYVNLLTATYQGEVSETALQGKDRTWTMLLTENQQEQQTMDGQNSQSHSEEPAQKNTSKSSSSWLSFLKLGIFHILTGYDHLLFLFALLISRQTIKQYIGTITAFTIAHSITLTLSVLGIVSIPSYLVEAMIALSICYVALENIFKKKINYRWAITFTFGLIHGMGFASLLKDMNLPKSNLAVALINFNLGIEFIQLMIVLLLIPVLLKLQKSMKYQRYMQIGSGIIFILGFIWLIQRLF